MIDVACVVEALRNGGEATSRALFIRVHGRDTTHRGEGVAWVKVVREAAAAGLIIGRPGKVILGRRTTIYRAA